MYDVLIVFLAAVLGYGTNWLAVKMLFRPLRAKYVFGRRVPFTPGMIPSRREEIARGMAEGIAQFLLTPEVIERELRDVDLLDPIEAYARDFAVRLSDEPEAIDEARRQMVRAAERIGESESVRQALSERIRPGLRASLGGVAAGGTMLVTSLPWLRNLPRKVISAAVGGAAALAAERLADEIAMRLAASAANAVKEAIEEGRADEPTRAALRGFPDAVFDPAGTIRPRLEKSLKDAIPEAARGIDVRGVLMRKLGSFDVEDLEALVLRASSTHLRAITWLGGVLGAIVGLVQVALRHALAN